MDKNGELTSRSPCRSCGHPGVELIDGVPYCAQHARQQRETKVAAPARSDVTIDDFEL